MKDLLLAAVLAAAACSGHETKPAAEAATAGRPVPDATLELFVRRTAADPRDHISAATLAELLARNSDFAAAEAAARTSLGRQPGYPRATVALARALEGQKRTDAAKRLVEGLLVIEPRNTAALCVAFDLALATGNVHTATAYADRLLAIDESPETLSRMARLAEHQGDGERAASLFRRAAADAKELGGPDDEIAEYREGARRATAGTR